MRNCKEATWQLSRGMILGLALVLPALAITASNGYAAAADSETTDDQERIQRTLVYRNQVIEQLQLPDKPQITVIVKYKKNAAKPMPVMLGWFGQRDRKIAELTKQLSATQGLTVTEDLPPMQAVMAELVDRGCALISFQNSKPELRPWPKGKAKWVWPTPDPAGAESFARSAKYAPGVGW